MDWTLGSHSGLLLVAVADSSGREVFPFLSDSASKCVEVVLFFLPLTGGIGFPPLPRPPWRKAGLGVFGYGVQSASETTAAPGLFNLFLGFLLWRLVRHQDQYLRQNWTSWFFGQ